MGKKKNKIRVRFIGKNATEVAGSCVLVETDSKKILLECGLAQGESTLLKKYQANTKKFDFKPKEIDYLFVFHLHLDHIGLIGRLVKEGFRGRIIAPSGSKSFFEVIGLDSAFIMQKDAQDLTTKFKKFFEPIFEEKHVHQALSLWEEFTVGEKIVLDDEVELRYLNSGHIINACQGELWVKNNNRTVKIGITSDLGNIKLQQYYVKEFEPIEKANLLIGETTYSDKNRIITKKNRLKDLEKIKSVVIETCIEKKGKVLIPSFALQRTQCILTYLYDLFGKDENFNIPIYIDSPLAIKNCELFLQELEGEQLEKFQEVMSWKNVFLLPEFNDTKEAIERKESCIFISCSGMLVGGRAVYNCMKLLPNANNHILFVGYSAEDTLAWRIKQKKTKTIAMNGKTVPCRCQITNLTSFSSHMQRDDLINYYSSGNFDKIALVHGDMKNKIEFGKDLQEAIGRKNKTNKVIAVNKGTEIIF